MAYREACALRGLGFGKKHSTVNYVFSYPIEYLVAYHFYVIKEMKRRNYKVASEWENPQYRGKILKYDNSINTDLVNNIANNNTIYKEHNNDYLLECITNLYNKNWKFTGTEFIKI